LDHENMNHTWVIMPTLDEADNLAWILPLLVNKYSVVVVDNGSSDGSGEVAEKLGAFLATCPTKGYGIAVQTGIKFVEDYYQKKLAESIDQAIVVIFDADGTSPITALETAVLSISENRSDLAIGQRTTLKVGAMPKHSEFGNWLQVTLIGKLTGVFYSDMGPLRAIRYSKIKALKMVDKTWGWNVEMQIKAALHQFRIDEFPVVYEKRRFGKSKISGSIIGSIRAASKIIFMIFYYYLTSSKVKPEPISQKNSI